MCRTVCARGDGGGIVFGDSIGHLGTPKQAWEKGRVGVAINQRQGPQEPWRQRQAQLLGPGPAPGGQMQDGDPHARADRHALDRWIWVRISVLLLKSCLAHQASSWASLRLPPPLDTEKDLASNSYVPGTVASEKKQLCPWGERESC